MFNRPQEIDLPISISHRIYMQQKLYKYPLHLEKIYTGRILYSDE